MIDLSFKEPSITLHKRQYVGKRLLALHVRFILRPQSVIATLWSLDLQIQAITARKSYQAS